MAWSETRKARRRTSRRDEAVASGNVWARIPSKPTASDGLAPIVLDGVAPAYLRDVPTKVLTEKNGAAHRAFFVQRGKQVPSLWDVKQELARRATQRNSNAA